MIKILFVCLGNICRSPSAEAIMKNLIEKNRLADKVDSAGTGSWHVGELPDINMRKAASKRNIALDTRARQFNINDLNNFDYVVAMDKQNLDTILTIGEELDNYEAKVFLITTFSTNGDYKSGVPDPYGLDKSRFDLVLDILSEVCYKFLEKLIKEHKLK